ncbi:hypothetical protein V8F33_008669 [Rhypophila sp. PSN 637]
METVGFVPEPNCGRGTIGIIWSCFSTLFLVIWVACHPPTSEPDSKESWLIDEKIRLCLLFFVIPEVGATAAIESLFSARKLRRDMRKIPGWEQFSLKQAFLVGGLEGLWEKEDSESKISGGNLVSLVTAGRLSFHDFPTDAEIDDRSKSSGLLKTISISQTLWSMVNVTYRLISNLPVTLLGDLTVAHAFCGLVMFIAWFRCPQDIHAPFLISTTPPTPGGIDTRTDKRSHELSEFSGLMITVVQFAIFASIHVAVWNYPYATTAEAWIWRVCSILIFGVGVLVAFGIIKDSAIVYSDRAPFWIIIGFYTVIRLAIIVVALMEFRRAPAGIYDKPTWSAYWIHLG